MSKDNIIILGHSGFIGTNLENYLSKSEGFNVIGRSLPEIDLTNLQDYHKLASFMNSSSTIILAAAVKRQFGDTIDIFDQNMKIVENLCRVLIDHPVKKVIYMSSTAVYGEETENRNISESTPVNPTSYYGINKFTSECLLRRSIDTKTKLICLRPPLIYGLGDIGKTYGPSGFISAAKEKSQITLWGDGTELREFIYIEDLCKIIEKLIHSDFEGALNIVSGISYSFIEIIRILRKIFPGLEYVTKNRSKEKVDNAFNPEKLVSLVGSDFSFVSLENGINKIITNDHV
ncbi:NAD-dependent epimerase/dehydratase family protein [Leptospira sp. GIMC2001]|uniref:NAD-dependent epimerase/dehydratase family protein n=1 Tax=Leptospira sp. GIMC2001 TaxID=1513297 RepID=UPI002349FC21|nr:NAD(P)-dependent oxidoreductase [Leptospira sp. GIMC2001]WCL51205.1 NAD(P)-dependent oxidoreductase [Leptospira sp. GIMC2001]